MTQEHPLRQYRRKHALNCDELGKKVGLAGSTIRSYENGNREVDADTAVMFERKLCIPRSKIRPDLWETA